MIYECRLTRLRKQYVIAGLLTISVLFLMSHFDNGSYKSCWSYSIGIALAIVILYLIGNSRVRVETTDGMVTVYHSGMVHAYIRKDSITEVLVSGEKSTSRITISTIDGLKYSIPCECFSDIEIGGLLNELREHNRVAAQRSRLCGLA
jgi:hypothetical protein